MGEGEGETRARARARARERERERKEGGREGRREGGGSFQAAFSPHPNVSYTHSVSSISLVTARSEKFIENTLKF
jgi:hypothetical protein